MNQEEIKQLNEKYRYVPAEELLSYYIKRYRGNIAFASNMGAEDQVLTHMIVSIDQTARIFTIDTEKLFNETYRLIEATNKRYHICIEIITPREEEIKKAFEDNSFKSIYESFEMRKKCCHIRKVEPLQRILKDLSAWITGMRKDQSVTRKAIRRIEWDDKYQLIKLNPIADWTEQQVWNYIRQHDIPYNILYERGFKSIGCEPCTRAIDSCEEDVRAGRWWWEKAEQKECGLHIK
ncbi:MAG: phosphoadenylyl-sulfate reductase [Bacteroidia bacterium]|nr:phosphoadenylyl-sulfate reductase [Bacteroidia bacterium]